MNPHFIKLQLSNTSLSLWALTSTRRKSLPPGLLKELCLKLLRDFVCVEEQGIVSAMVQMGSSFNSRLDVTVVPSIWSLRFLSFLSSMVCSPFIINRVPSMAEDYHLVAKKGLDLSKLICVNKTDCVSTHLILVFLCSKTFNIL